MTCHVVLLDNSQFVTTFDQKIVLGKDLFDLVCQRVQVPTNKKQYFGLQYIDHEDGDLNWLNLDKALLTSRKSEPLVYQFAVKVFPKDPLKMNKACKSRYFYKSKVSLTEASYLSQSKNTPKLMASTYKRL